jgi:hypothetical protein
MAEESEEIGDHVSSHREQVNGVSEKLSSEEPSHPSGQSLSKSSQSPRHRKHSLISKSKISKVITPRFVRKLALKSDPSKFFFPNFFTFRFVFVREERRGLVKIEACELTNFTLPLLLFSFCKQN